MPGWPALVERQYAKYATEQAQATTAVSCAVSALIFAGGSVAALRAGAHIDACFHLLYAAFCYLVPMSVAKHCPEHLGAMWLAAHCWSAVTILTLVMGCARCHCMSMSIQRMGRPIMVGIMRLLLFGPHQQVGCREIIVVCYCD